ncbi:MAG: hypothetical protein JXB60_04835 [Candidatus Cloacimonetes bacterium]|nr:hypothetical protein [Candidatus Cloacimonadota bacterium]
MAADGIRKQLDRRWIFLLIFIGVAVPLIVKIGFPIETSENAQLVYELVDNTSPGTRVIMSFDYDPASQPELHPMGRAVMKHCFDRGLKVIVTALWPMGVLMAQDIYDKLKTDYPEITYGSDYINLGYKAGGIVTIQALGSNFREVFPKDMNGTEIDSLPIMKGIKDFENIGFIFALSAGDPGIKQWVQVAHDKFGRHVSGGVTGVSAPSILPYVNEQKQLYGLLAGLKAAAEYESLINDPGLATSGMDAQSIAHLIIIIFIAIGNISYWIVKKKNKSVGGE